uniref:2-oxoacid:acceptor oxidoreductase subunit alpha n=1 Tax=candidate division WOR-3 bacterium TaxID=2052148 RepID=A0A7C3YT80_UNCW3
MRRLLSGNEACALGAIKAGIRFFAGYPITPSTEIAEFMARELPKQGGIFLQMEDEIASINAVIGARAAGMKAMTATSGPGFSLMQEGIGYACMAEIPCLVVDVQRAGPATGLPTKPSQGDVMQARWGTHGDHPTCCLYPETVAETYSLSVAAVNLSEYLRMPVILLMDEIIAHMREVVDLPEEVETYTPERKKKPKEFYRHYDEENNYGSEFAHFGEGYRIHISGLTHRPDGFPTNDPKVIAWKMERLKRKITENLHLFSDLACEYFDLGAETCLVSYGASARSAREAKNLYEKERKRPLGFIRLRVLWPFPAKKLSILLESSLKVVVVEMNQGQLLGEIERCVSPKIPVIPVNRVDGEMITPEEILSVL